MIKLVSVLCTALLLNASNIPASEKLTLDEAIEILQSQNLEIKTSELDIKVAKADAKSVSGSNLGKVDFIQDVVRSNDAGNVFGFKLTSREANFRDFGFSDFLDGIGQAMQASNGDFTTFTNMMTSPQAQDQMLNTEPDDLNYPEARNFFQSKLKYEVPLFTGFQISSYQNIMKAMTRMKTLEHKQMIREKVYQLRKSFYDMALLRKSTKLLNKILQNIETLENMTQQMIDVGYAKKVDLLEVQAKKGNVKRLISQMQSNQKLLYHFISFLLNQEVHSIETPSQAIDMPTCTNDDVIANNIDIQRAKTGLEIREGMIGVSKSAYYPMVGAFAEIATADDTFLGDAGDHQAYTFGARLTWNLFNGGTDKAKVEKSRIEQLKTKTQVELAKKGIALKVDKIRTEIDSYDSDIASLEKELLLANEIYNNYEGRYREKLVSMSDVIIKQSEQIQKILQLQMVKNKRNERIFALIKLANGDN